MLDRRFVVPKRGKVVKFKLLIRRARIRQRGSRQPPANWDEAPHVQTESSLQKSSETTAHFNTPDPGLNSISQLTGDFVNVFDQQNFGATSMPYYDRSPSTHFHDLEPSSLDETGCFQGEYVDSIISPVYGLNTGQHTQFTYQHNAVPFAGFQIPSQLTQRSEMDAFVHVATDELFRVDSATL